MAEPAFQLVETREVATRALSVVEQAKSIKVVDSDTYSAAGLLWKAIVDMIKEVDDAFDKNIKRWHEGHKAAIADKAKYWNPLDSAKKSVKKIMSDYDTEQERIRQAEQRRLEEIARKEEEERRLAEAIAAEEAARASGATVEEAAQEATAIIEEPVMVAPVVVEKQVPKMAGGPVYQTRWKFMITDAKKIPREYLIPDEVKIGGVVRAMKGTTNIPGIQAYPERV